jgi:hypothetical protein
MRKVNKIQHQSGNFGVGITLYSIRLIGIRAARNNTSKNILVLLLIIFPLTSWGRTGVALAEPACRRLVGHSLIKFLRPDFLRLGID